VSAATLHDAELNSFFVDRKKSAAYLELSNLFYLFLLPFWNHKLSKYQALVTLKLQRCGNTLTSVFLYRTLYTQYRD
jgi:hypothetical protein